MSKTDVGVGFVRVDAPANTPDLTIAFTDKDGNILGANQYLRVAKWNDAFQVVNGRLGIKGPEALPDGRDFIDRDNDRFNIRIKDAAKWGAKTAGTPDNPTITITLKTTNVAGYTAYNDDETTITLTRMKDDIGWNGWYWSDSQILVSNEADDKYQGANVGADDTAPDATKLNDKAGHKFQLSDRTHRIALEGTVTAKYGAAEKPITVKKEKVVKLHVNILQNNNVAVIAKADVEKQVARMNEVYAQVGIRVDATINSPVNAPNNVNLNDGLDLNAPPVADVVRLGQTYKQGGRSAEQVALLSAPGLWAKDPANANKKDLSIIHVYYIGSFTNRPGVLGAGLPSSYEPLWGDTVLMSSTQEQTVLAHEAFHVIENIGMLKTLADIGIDPTHYPNNLPGGTFRPVDRVNLMVTGRGQIMLDPPSPLNSIRLDADQQNRAYARTDLVKDPT